LYSNLRFRIDRNALNAALDGTLQQLGAEGHALWTHPAEFLKLKSMPKLSSEANIPAIYSTLVRAWGRQHWWPAKSRFEVIVGAYLTQNTSWRNVEIAMHNLRAARVLSVEAIRNISIARLERLIRSSGYFRQKARKLKTFVKFLDRCYGGSLTKMFAQPTAKLREELLSLNGVGPETADSILLYAGQHPVFVVDAYTRRLADRHGILAAKADYEDVRSLFERALTHTPELASIMLASETSGSASHPPSRMSLAARSPQAQIFNEMHGLIVSVGKQYCLKSKAQCEKCPLGPLLTPNATV
jgi:endonuclease-3 related protein